MNRGVLTGYRPFVTNAERFQDFGVVAQALTLTMCYANAINYAFSPSAAVTVLVRDWPPVGQLGILTVEVLGTGAGSITWPTTWVWVSDSGSAPTLPPSGKRKTISAMTRDNGLTVVASASSATP